MPRMSLDFTNFSRLLDEYREIRQVDIPDAVQLHARLLAVELGRRTQPFGFDSQQVGETRVEKDIKQIVKVPAHLYGVAARLRSQGLAKRIRELTSSGAWSSLQTLLANARFGAFEFIGGDIGPVHRAHRAPNTGRTYRRADKLYVADSTSLQGYIDSMKRLVGLSKAGWAACASQLRQVNASSLTRGFPSWVLRHNGSGRVANDTVNLQRPTVSMTNGTPWADRVVPLVEQVNALNNIAARMKRQMSMILKNRNRAAARTE